MQTEVSIPFLSGQGFRRRTGRPLHTPWRTSQSPSYRVKVSDPETRHRTTTASLRSQSPSYRVKVSDTGGHKLFPLRDGRLNPLPIGSRFPTNFIASGSIAVFTSQSPSYRVKVSDAVPTHPPPPIGISLNPLPIGSRFPTHNGAHCAGRHRRGLNPLPIGSRFPTGRRSSGPTAPKSSQSPSYRVKVSDCSGGTRSSGTPVQAVRTPRRHARSSGWSVPGTRSHTARGHRCPVHGIAAPRGGRSPVP